MSLHLLCGISGSGKSTLAGMIQKSLPYSVILESDAIVSSLCGKDFTLSSYALARGIISTMVEVLYAQGFSPIIDDIHVTRKERDHYVKLAKKLNASIYCHALNIPLFLCKENNTRRKRKVPDFLIDEQASFLEKVSFDEGFDGYGVYKEKREDWDDVISGIASYTRLWEKGSPDGKV